MKINLEGAPNARDLGGIVTPYGTVKPHRLIRSGELSLLTANDVEVLKAIPLVRVLDLRTDMEQANCPDVEIEGVVHQNVAIIEATTFGITYDTSSGGEIAQMLAMGFERMARRGETFGLHMQILYKKFVNDTFSRNGYGNFLKILANQPTDGATLWHCTAGKDRVGTCTALLLHCLGASREQIIADYLLTNEQSNGRKLAILEKVKAYVPAEYLGMVDNMLSASESYLNAFFDEINLHYGNIDAFIAACGVTEEDITKLRDNYLE